MKKILTVVSVVALVLVVAGCKDPAHHRRHAPDRHAARPVDPRYAPARTPARTPAPQPAYRAPAPARTPAPQPVVVQPPPPRY